MEPGEIPPDPDELCFGVEVGRLDPSFDPFHILGLDLHQNINYDANLIASLYRSRHRNVHRWLHNPQHAG